MSPLAATPTPEPSPITHHPAQKSKSAKARSRAFFVVAYLSPAVLLYALFVIWPLIQAFRFSLYRWSGYSAQGTYIGGQNFKQLIYDDVFWLALKHNMGMLVVVGFLAIAFGVLFAHTMTGTGPIQKLLRSVYLFPQVISLVVVAVLWEFIYDPAFGLLTSGLKAIHLDRLVHTWLGDAHTALWCVMASFLWYVVGFYIMLFTAGLKGIPQEVNEAASLDGALGFRRFRTVTWPMLWSIKRIAVVYVVINVMNVFTLVYIMTVGGPDRGTEVLLTYLYERSFKDSQFGYGTAIAVANFVVAMLLSLLLMFVFRKNPEESN